MRILVTGGSGFIGQNLVKYLEERDHDVFNYDLNEGYDITDFNQLRGVIETGFDQIYHVAAQAFLGPGENDPCMDMRVNGFGMLNLLKCLEDENIPMVYTSSGAVYGLSEIPHKEDLVCVPMSNYGVSKLAAENYLRKWVKTMGIDAKITRFSSVYGPHRKHGPVNIFINLAKQRKPITVYGQGTQTRDLVHVHDAIRGVERVLERGKRGEIYNIGLGEEHSVMEVAKIVTSVINVPIEHVKYEQSAFDLPRSWFDITKVQKLGYNPMMPLELGIRSTIFDMERGE